MVLDEAERRARRQRRRETRGQLPDNSVPSPCIQVCQIDSGGSHCIGCLRDLDEIRDWPIMTAEEKRATLAAIEVRRSAGTRGRE